MFVSDGIVVSVEEVPVGEGAALDCVGVLVEVESVAIIDDVVCRGTNRTFLYTGIGPLGLGCFVKTIFYSRAVGSKTQPAANLRQTSETVSSIR